MISLKHLSSLLVARYLQLALLLYLPIVICVCINDHSPQSHQLRFLSAKPLLNRNSISIREPISQFWTWGLKIAAS